MVLSLRGTAPESQMLTIQNSRETWKRAHLKRHAHYQKLMALSFNYEVVAIQYNWSYKETLQHHCCTDRQQDSV